MKKPPEKDADHPLAENRPPEYVIVTWVCAEFRERAQRNCGSLAEALEVGKKQDCDPAHPELEDREAE